MVTASPICSRRHERTPTARIIPGAIVACDDLGDVAGDALGRARPRRRGRRGGGSGRRGRRCSTGPPRWPRRRCRRAGAPASGPRAHGRRCAPPSSRPRRPRRAPGGPRWPPRARGCDASRRPTGTVPSATSPTAIPATVPSAVTGKTLLVPVDRARSGMSPTTPAASRAVPSPPRQTIASTPASTIRPTAAVVSAAVPVIGSSARNSIAGHGGSTPGRRVLIARTSPAEIPARSTDTRARSMPTAPQPDRSRATVLTFSAIGNTDAPATSRRMSRPDIGLATMPTAVRALTAASMHRPNWPWIIPTSGNDPPNIRLGGGRLAGRFLLVGPGAEGAGGDPDRFATAPARLRPYRGRERPSPPTSPARPSAAGRAATSRMACSRWRRSGRNTGEAMAGEASVRAISSASARVSSALAFGPRGDRLTTVTTRAEGTPCSSSEWNSRTMPSVPLSPGPPTATTMSASHDRGAGHQVALLDVDRAAPRPHPRGRG